MNVSPTQEKQSVSVHKIKKFVHKNKKKLKIIRKMENKQFVIPLDTL